MMRILKPSLLRAPARCVIRSSVWSRRIPQLSPYSTTRRPPDRTTEFEIFKKSLNLWKPSPRSAATPGTSTCLDGFLVKKRDKGSNLCFFLIQLNDEARSTVQVVSSWQKIDSKQHAAHLKLKSAQLNSPVSVEVTVEKKQPVDTENSKAPFRASGAGEAYEFKLKSVQCLNTFPRDIIVSKNAVWPLKSRHLRMRFDPLLHERLRFRDRVASLFRRTLESQEFNEVETPLLFKSTPEGAREFLVPTRQKGFAYALPQSPQQYKQILMAGGFSRYFQFARCFRDEDHRADRQPEFTQLDLEMGFARGDTVMKLVENLMESLSAYMRAEYTPTKIDNCQHPKRKTGTTPDSPSYDLLKTPIIRMPYDLCMRKYGTDKPDLRIKLPHVTDIIDAVNWFSPVFQGMITSLEKPIVELCKFRFTGSLEQSATFIREFFDELPKTPYRLSGDGVPGVFVFDSSKPLNGLSSLGHEGAEKLTEFSSESWTPLENGDVVIVHARRNLPTQGGSTELGRLRKLIYDAAVAAGLLPKDNSFHFLWVTEFPLFSPNDDGVGPGQGGSAGFSSTHHPFTSPLTAEDFDLLATDPLRAKADHYDLVLNGVEVGGGSRRIHVAEVQRYIMSDILKMTDEGVGQFSHLLEALRAGCPPHAGFAMGFDRLVSVLCDVPTVRAVIAFPKNNKMQDQLVGSPSRTTPSQQKTYHLFGEPQPEPT